MSTRSPVTRAFVHVLRGNQDAVVRLSQLSTTVGALAVVALELSIGNAEDFAVPAFVLGVALLVGATVVAFTVRWSTLRATATMPLALISIVALGTLQAAGPTGSTIGTLCVLPAIWMGIQHRWRGVIASTVASTVVAVVAAVLETGPNSAMARASDLVIPVLVLLVAAIMTVAHDLWDEQTALAHRQGAELERTVSVAQESSDLLGAIFDVVDSGLLVVEPDGHFATMNSAMRRFRAVLGTSHVDRAGQYQSVWHADRVTPVPPDDAPTRRAARGETFRGETYWFGERGAEQIGALVSARQLTARDGSPRGALMVYQDVTQLMLALQAKDDFVASVSHELRTPLTSILGYLELMEQEPAVDGQLRRQLDVVTRNADRLLGLVSDLLTVAQAEGGSMRLIPVPSDLSELVGRATQSARVRADRRDVTLVADVVQLDPISLDPARITQVLDNLLSNAIKYTPPGGQVTATVRAERDDAVITITDTGIGIGDDDRDRLFTKFFRTREAERRAIPGVGLGLVITKAIVDEHGGAISLMSRLGEGTTVTVRLPR